MNGLTTAIINFFPSHYNPLHDGYVLLFYASIKPPKEGMMPHYEAQFRMNNHPVGIGFTTHKNECQSRCMACGNSFDVEQLGLKANFCNCMRNLISDEALRKTSERIKNLFLSNEVMCPKCRVTLAQIAGFTLTRSD